MTEIPNSQRALWTFLMYTLVGPFFAALAVAAFLILAPALGLDQVLTQDVPGIGEGATGAFVWSAIPSALAALGLLPLVLKRGTIGWIEAAAAGAVAFSAAAVLFPIAERGLLPYLAFVAGLVSLAVRQVLIGANILRS